MVTGLLRPHQALRSTKPMGLCLAALLTLLAAGCNVARTAPPAGAGTAAPAAAATGSAAAPTPASPSAAVMADLAPSGKLLVAVQATPPFLAQKDPTTNAFKGVAVALATALAARLGVSLEIVEVDAPPQILADLATGKWDIAFLPEMPATAQAVDLTAPFILVGHTVAVRAESTFHAMGDVDMPGVRIASGADAVHTPPLAAFLKQAALVKVDEADALAMLKGGQVDGYADNRFSLARTASQDSTIRVLDGDFFTVKLGVGVAKGHAAGLAYLTQFVEGAKSSGMVQQAIDATGLPLTVAPAG